MTLVKKCLIVIAVLSLWGCKQKRPPEGSAQGAEKNSSKALASRSGTGKIPQPEKGKFNVAFVYIGPVGDGGWTYAHDQGRKYLEKQADIKTAYIENVAEGAEAEQVIRSLARKGFALIIGTSFGYMDAMETVAKEFPNTRFVHISGYKSNGENFGNLFGAMESMKYLAGMIAGARAMADNQTKLGYIAPFPIPEVIRLGNAAMLGAQTTCPKCTMEIRWINTWFDPNREREAADSLFKAGVHVVITGADTPGPIIAAKDLKRWAIGYDSSNACQVAPERCLTAPYWNWGPVYANLINRIKSGQWKGGNEYLDVQSGIVSLFGFMEGEEVPKGVPADVVPKVKKLLKRMQEGKFTHFDIFKGPLRSNEDKPILEADQMLTQKDLEGLKGCKVCMSWLAQGIIGQIPQKNKANP